MGRCSRLLSYGLPLISAVAFGWAAISIARSNAVGPDAAEMLDDPGGSAPLQAVSAPPRADFIGAAGLVEPAGGAIYIGADVSGIVSEVFAFAGQKVAQGDPLFKIDDQIAEAVLRQRHRDLAVALARLEQARARVPGLNSEVHIARSALEAASADRDEARDMVRIAGRLEQTATMSARESTRRGNLLRAAEARLSEAEARLQQALANLSLYGESGGASIQIEKAAVAQAEAAVAHAERNVKIRTVRAPTAGTVLQVNVRPGQHTDFGSAGGSLLTIGRIEPVHVRVDIDEADIPRWRADARATARLRAPAPAAIRLIYERREPIVVPKRSLTGGPGERVDTRVMQVIYSAEVSGVPLLPGQQLDILLELEPNNHQVMPVRTRSGLSPRAR